MGMKPCFYSARQNRLHGTEWFRGGENVKYFQNEIPRKTTNIASNGGNPLLLGNNQFLYDKNGAGEGLEYYFTLSFIYEFDEEEDELWIAQAVPYTFTNLQDDLLAMQTACQGRNLLSCNILCKELTGSPVPLLTITDSVDTFMDYYDQV
jgi:hypothetical protein